MRKKKIAQNAKWHHPIRLKGHAAISNLSTTKRYEKSIQHTKEAIKEVTI